MACVWKTFTTPTIKKPKKPAVDSNGEMDELNKEIWKEEIKQYVTRKREIETNMRKIYAVVWPMHLLLHTSLTGPHIVLTVTAQGRHPMVDLPLCSLLKLRGPMDISTLVLLVTVVDVKGITPTNVLGVGRTPVRLLSRCSIIRHLLLHPPTL